MSLLLLFAGAGVQAPIAPTQGSICGVLQVQQTPIGAFSQVKTVGIIDASILDGSIVLSNKPSGITTSDMLPSGSILISPDGIISAVTKPEGSVDPDERPAGQVEECEE